MLQDKEINITLSKLHVYNYIEWRNAQIILITSQIVSDDLTETNFACRLFSRCILSGQESVLDSQLRYFYEIVSEISRRLQTEIGFY